MQLVGQLSNPSPSLVSVFDAPADRRQSPHLVVLQEPRRLGNGVVQRAVVKALSEAGGAMRLSDIHGAVERLVGQRVSIESVSWCLRTDANGGALQFERVERGIYRLSGAL